MSEIATPEVKLVEAVPLAEKVFTTESVGISRKTHEEHFKLYQGYANKTNEIRKRLAELDKDPAKANQVYSEIRALKVDYTFAYGGFINHTVYFDILGGNGEPSGEVLKMIERDFGSFEAFQQDLKASGMGGRGWVWLAYDHEEKTLFNYIGDAQNTYPMWNCTPILALDVYEHAYYLDFGTARAQYIDAFLKVIDWDAVNRRLQAVL
ncbi:MAG: superoxide dismutase [Fe] [Fimbriimonadales bacterium]|nr:MAG: superoxide dismutase [Fe] [Fimbriimonadales bacterium]